MTVNKINIIMLEVIRRHWTQNLSDRGALKNTVRFIGVVLIQLRVTEFLTKYNGGEDKS